MGTSSFTPGPASVFTAREKEEETTLLVLNAERDLDAEPPQNHPGCEPETAHRVLFSA